MIIKNNLLFQQSQLDFRVQLSQRFHLVRQLTYEPMLHEGTAISAVLGHDFLFPRIFDQLKKIKRNKIFYLIIKLEKKNSFQHTNCSQ